VTGRARSSSSRVSRSCLYLEDLLFRGSGTKQVWV
jgi:hypothetical protein